jgi:hypothetical protein
MCVGRAVEFFADQAAGVIHSTLTSCPHNDLANPDRAYVDAYGYVQICPGIAIGNTSQDPLNEIITNFDAKTHDILSILVEYGPAGLIDQSGLPSDTKIVDACHGCYKSRKQLIDEYPDLLGPRHVYGY